MARMSKTYTKKKNNIELVNERSEYITKAKNTLGGWGFFRYLYSKFTFRIVGLNLIMIMLFLPMFYVILRLNGQISNAAQYLPFSNTFGLGLAPWDGVQNYLASVTRNYTMQKYLWLLLCVPVAGMAFTGGFAVIRDSYWTGKLKIVKPFFIGIYKCGLQNLPLYVLVGGGLLGIYAFSIGTLAWARWIAVIVQVLLWIVLALLTMYALVFTGVNCLHKQSFFTTLVSSFKICYTHIISHIITFIFVALPLTLMFIIGTSVVASLLIVANVLMGMLYVAIVWMIHMIRTCGNYSVVIEPAPVLEAEEQNG